MLHLQMVKMCCFIYMLLIVTLQKSEWSFKEVLHQRNIVSVHNGWLSLQKGKIKLTRIKFQAKQGTFILLNINHVCIMFP